MNHKRQRMSEARQGNRAAETAPNYSAQESDDCDPGSELQLLKNLSKEVEAYRTRAGSGGGGAPGVATQAVEYRPTYRAVLAKRGFLVKGTLGSGSYSKVKMAQCLNKDLPLDRVAVKIIDRSKAPQDFQEKFLPRELEIWPRLSHCNIVRMIDYFQDESRVFMILEYCERGDALRYIQKSGALAEAVGKIWVHQVADAVRYLHDMDITHRDLKLENMLLDAQNNVKLCDFGFVKKNCMADLSRTFCGSKSYAAPEILKGEPYEPKKADVWAVGVIAFILVTGRMPFDETKGNASLLEEHRKLSLSWPRGHRKVTQDCRGLVRYCFAFAWADRPGIRQVLQHAWFRQTLSPALVAVQGAAVATPTASIASGTNNGGDAASTSAAAAVAASAASGSAAAAAEVTRPQVRH